MFTEGRTLVKFMIRAPDPRPPLATPTVLLLPHKLQLFTSRNFVHCFLKISLQPFRYYPKASRSFKFTPFRFQITVPIFSQSSDSLYCQLSQIATPKPDLHSPKLQRLLSVRVVGQRSKQGKNKEKMVPVQEESRNRWVDEERRKKMTATYCQKKKKKERKEKKGKGKIMK